MCIRDRRSPAQLANARVWPVSYTHLRAHETSLHLVCRLLLEKNTLTTPTCQTHAHTTTPPFLMIRRPPRSTHCISSAASDVYKRQTKSSWVPLTIWQDIYSFCCIHHRHSFFLCVCLRTIVATTKRKDNQNYGITFFVIFSYSRHLFLAISNLPI